MHICFTLQKCIEDYIRETDEKNTEKLALREKNLSAAGL